jgi:CRISPR-associated RAMP protein (TIGR02581 family)
MRNERKEQAFDMRAFHRRLTLRGTLVLSTGLRVGAGRDPLLETSELPVVKTVDGRPYIPGTSFKGAWRAATETLLRGVQSEAGVTNLACLSVPRLDERPPDEPPDTCLYQAEVARLKATPPDRWGEILGRRATQVTGKSLDEALRTLSCLTCRVFGAPWLAGKALVKDLPASPGWEDLVQPQVRDGVAIDRDKGNAAYKRKFAYEVVPASTPFAFEAIVENAGDVELGLAWLGLLAFQQGQIPMGGARSRGLGWCELEIDWQRSQWLTQEQLLASIFPEEPARPAGILAEDGPIRAKEWWQAFMKGTGLKGSDDA